MRTVYLLANCLFATVVHAQEISRSVPRGPSHPLQLTIELPQTTYHVGDTIKVRLTLRNSSDKPIKIPEPVPTTLARLRVIDAGGRRVQPTVIGELYMVHGWEFGLAARQELILVNNARQEWISLRDWGYDLRAPGSYTILGSPGLPPDSSMTGSARVMITVTR